MNWLGMTSKVSAKGGARPASHNAAAPPQRSIALPYAHGIEHLSGFNSRGLYGPYTADAISRREKDPLNELRGSMGHIAIPIPNTQWLEQSLEKGREGSKMMLFEQKILALASILEPKDLEGRSQWQARRIVEEAACETQQPRAVGRMQRSKVYVGTAPHYNAEYSQEAQRLLGEDPTPKPRLHYTLQGQSRFTT